MTNAAYQQAYIEFLGGLAAQAKPLITVEVQSFEPGIVTFLLPLDRSVLASALRTAESVTFPLEVKITYVEDEEDPEDEDILSKTVTLYQQEVTILRGQITPERAGVADINWLPPLPRVTTSPSRQTRSSPVRSTTPLRSATARSGATPLRTTSAPSPGM